MVVGILDLFPHLIPQVGGKQLLTFSLIQYNSTEFSQHALKYDFACPLLPSSMAFVLEESQKPLGQEHDEELSAVQFNRNRLIARQNNLILIGGTSLVIHKRLWVGAAYVLFCFCFFIVQKWVVVVFHKGTYHNN